MAKAVGLEPQSAQTTENAKLTQNEANLFHINALGSEAGSPQDQTLAFPEHKSSVFENGKCAACVHLEKIPGDLAEVVAAWPELPQKIRAEILVKVKAGK